MTRAFEESASRAEFRHVMQLGANEALRIGLENDAAAAEAVAAEDESDDGDVDDNLDEAEAHIVDLVEAILREKGLQPMGNQDTLKVVEVILNPTFSSWRSARDMLATMKAPLGVFVEAIARAREKAAIDQKLSARAECTLKYMADSTLVSWLRGSQQPMF
ncbi:hypothetical protein M885DRAFT_547294 [Pelagophyceae sp. CCMP2097]|nr:hypothetical protein M885DRAFT_547294 [Pelagophyceae sp. CCMP2097]